MSESDPSTLALHLDISSSTSNNTSANTSKSEWDFSLKLSLGSDGDDQSDDAGKSTSSSHRFSSPNPSEQEDFHEKKSKRRRGEQSLSEESVTTTPKSGRQQHFPLSERQQLALVMQQSASESAKSPTHLQTPTSTGKSRGKQPKISRRNDKGESLLHVASKRGDKRLAKSLIRQGADVNAVDYAGWTPLHESCNHGFYDVAKLLIKHGASVNVCGLEKDTPLHDAAISGNVKLVLLLLKHGAHLDSVNCEGQKPVDVATSPEVTEILGCSNDDLATKFGTISWSPSSSSNSASEDDFETDVTGTPKSFGSPLPSPPHESGLDGKGKLHSPKMASATLITKERPKLDREKNKSSDNNEPKSSLENGLERGEEVDQDTTITDISPPASAETTPQAAEQSRPTSLAVTPATAASGSELPSDTPKLKREMKNLDQHSAEDSRRSARPPRASFRARMDCAAFTGDRPESESARGRRSQKSKKRKSEHDVYEFHSSDSDEERLQPVSGGKLANFHDSGAASGSTPKAVSAPTVGSAPVGQKKLDVCEKSGSTDEKSTTGGVAKEEKFQPPKTAFEIAISESFATTSRSMAVSGRGRGKHSRVVKPKPNLTPAAVLSEPEAKTFLETRPLNEKSVSATTVDPPPPQANTVAPMEPLAPKPEEILVAADSMAPMSPSTSEAAQKDDAEVAAISSNGAAADDRSDSDTPSSSQSDASLKVPPLRIVFPTTSRSNSAVSEAADMVTNNSHPVAVTSGSSGGTGVGRLPYVVKLKEEAGQQDAVDETRSVETSEASDDETTSVAPANDGTQSESDQSRSMAENKPTGGRKSLGHHSKRVTRSQARRGSHKDPQPVVPLTDASAESEEVDKSSAAASAVHLVVHPKRRKYHRRDPHNNTAASTSSAWQSTGGLASSYVSSTVDQSGSVTNASALSANDLPSLTSYEGFKELRTRVEKKWPLHTEEIGMERPANFDKYLIKSKKYLMENQTEHCISKVCPPPTMLGETAERLFTTQEAARHSLRMQHQVERERLQMACEKEVIRAYNRHSRVQAGQADVTPFSYVQMLHDAEIYNPLELDKPHTHSHTGTADSVTSKPLTVSVDEVVERFRKRKTQVIAQHRMECDSLTALQRMEWESMLKRLKGTGLTRLPQQLEIYVPSVEVPGDFTLLPL